MDLLNLVFNVNSSQVSAAQQKVQQLMSSSNAAQGSASSLSSALNSVGQQGGIVGQAANYVQGLTSQLGAATASAGLLLPAMLAVVGAAGALAAIRFAGVVDDIGDMAAKFGLSATQAYVLDQQLKASGTSVDAYYGAVQRMAVALSKGTEEGKEGAAALKLLGVNAREGISPVQAAGEVAALYGEKLKQGKVSADEMAALQKVLGKNYMEAVVAIDQASVANERLNGFMTAHIGITEDGIKAAGDFEQAQNDAHVVLTAVGSQLVAKVVPAFTQLINQLVESYKNGGLVKVAFDGIQFAANAVMVPIRVLINLFITLDTVITSVGKGIGAVFAALATRSTEPLKLLREDLNKLFEEADKKVKAVGLWGTDSNNVQKPQQLQTTGTTGALAGKPAASGPSARESDATKAIVEQERALARLRSEYQQLFGVQQQTASAMLEAEIASGRFKEATDDLGRVIKKGATDAELAAMRQKAADQDRLASLIKTEQAEKRAWEAADRAIQTEQDKATAMRQANAEHRIALQVMSRYGATQDDVNIAITDYNIAQAQTALAIATARGATEQELAVLRQKLSTLKELRDLQGDRKDDNDAAAAGQQTFGAGWKNAFDQYTRDASNASKVGEQMFTSLTSNMEGALNQFVMTGKFSFKDFTKSILADIAQIMAKQALLWAVKSMMGYADGGAFNGGTQFFANGGVVSSPTAFGMSGGRVGVMGEAGPEAIMPLKRLSNGKLGVVAEGGGGGGSVANTYNVTVSIGSVDSQERQNELMKAIKETIVSTSKQTMANELRPGGMLHKHMAR